jgi:hypothetical protein
MPDGGDGYVAISDFVVRFGLDDGRKMTDADDGRIRRQHSSSAASAAVQAIADVFISPAYASRYAVLAAEVVSSRSRHARPGSTRAALRTESPKREARPESCSRDQRRPPASASRDAAGGSASAAPRPVRRGSSPIIGLG